jgi:predicted Fe-S protein YdhL (DUF1289 family)
MYILLRNKIKEDEMGRACAMCGRILQTRFQWENLKKRDHLENLKADKTVILKWILK